MIGRRIRRAAAGAIVLLLFGPARHATGADLDPSVPAPASILGAPVGTRPASTEEIGRAFEAIAAASPRVRVETYGRSPEGRSLRVAIVSAPENLDRRDEILRRFAEAEEGHGSPRLDDLPVVIWVGAAVHGDEASGADAALVLVHHLAADRSEVTRAILEKAIVLVDPVQNPDGRNRFLTDVAMWSGRVPDTDPQSVPHRRPWPSPRGNHYFINGNRDWFALSQPETRARAELLVRWSPQVTFDLHETAGYDTYLLSPPREPYNPHLPETVGPWWDRFASAVAAEFGRRGWGLATGDWNEEFNPNRGASWPLFRGAVALLGEQATTDGMAVRRVDGATLTYAGAVERQYVAALEVVRVAAEARGELLADYVRARRGEGLPVAGEPRAFVIDASSGGDRARLLAEVLAAEGVPVLEATGSFRDDGATSYWGERRGDRPFEAGSFVIPLDRPGARLARAVLDFDPVLDDRFLADERRRRELGEPSLLYESPAWSLAMAYGVDVYESHGVPGRNIRAFEPGASPPGLVQDPDAPFGFLLDPNGSGADRALAALLQVGVPCVAIPGPFTFDGRPLGAGAVFVPRASAAADLPERLIEIAGREGATFFGVSQALSDEGPDLGSRDVRPIHRPRIALLAGPPFYETTFGALWQWIDAVLELPVSLLRAGSVAGADLEAYDVIVAPDAASGRGSEIAATLGGDGMMALGSWVDRGGTLVTLGESNWILFGDAAPLVSFRARRQILAEAGPWMEAIGRESSLAEIRVDGDGLRAGEWSASGSDSSAAGAKPVTVEEDERLRRFAPDGAILRADLDANHWLAAGVGPRVPVIVNTDLALVSRVPAQTVGRFADAASIRLSGLLWPEARERWARTTYLCREKIGDGQVISFLGNPTYRGYFLGTGRLFTNALLLGPALGTTPRVPR